MMASAPILKHDKVIPAAAVVKAVLAVTGPRGAPEHKILRGTGIFTSDVKKQLLVSPAQLITLLANAQSYASGPDVAFQIGKSMATAHLTGTWHGIGSCHNVLDALQVMTRFRWHFCPLMSIAIYAGNGKRVLTFQDPFGCGKLWSFVTQLYGAFFVSLFRYWLGQRLACEFRFNFPRPRYVHEYEAHLGFRLVFDQPMLSVQLDIAALKNVFPKRDPFYRQALLSFLQENAASPDSLLDVVREQIAERQGCTLSSLASWLDYSPATLKRKLREHQTTFSELSDQVRRQQAIYWLSVQKLNNEQSALQMAFTDLPNFRRAVKRWTGQTPSELREI